MKHIKLFEEIEKLPKSVDIDSELDQLRELEKEKDSIKTSDYKDLNAKILSKEYEVINDKQDIIEKKIKAKIFPIMMKYLDSSDYEGAKWFVGRSYRDMNTYGKTLLFRSILIHQQQNIEKYNL